MMVLPFCTRDPRESLLLDNRQYFVPNMREFTITLDDIILNPEEVVTANAESGFIQKIQIDDDGEVVMLENGTPDLQTIEGNVYITGIPRGCSSCTKKGLARARWWLPRS